MECSRTSIYRALSIFESDNPQTGEIMKKEGKFVIPEDYKRLSSEIVKLKKELAQERLRGMAALFVRYGACGCDIRPSLY